VDRLDCAREFRRLHLSSTVHGTSNSLGQNLPAKTVSSVGVLSPILPAGLKEVRRGHEGVVPEDGSHGELVIGPIRKDKLLDLIGQVSGELTLDSRAELVCCQQTGFAIESEDRHALHQRLKGFESLWEFSRSSLVRHEASRGGYSEGVERMRHLGGDIVDVRELPQGSGRGVGHLGPSHDDGGRQMPGVWDNKMVEDQVEG